ncbi:hypothetical protein HUB98_09260 [Paenibacillus barcinonensis]|uniref:Uncharacterized protein n=1 Tax=Paenibacillus barcinonensis TaxID=198119 RepID=A0A2V4WPN2_PAEBA|nr:hypothetical protein [Paenibacillus barcinonensis]PYE49812.1 hypothetical protein DFQ00_105316 [Paenibacillus barcinonensis]QKS56510.1 hypothetical protein HUB98_09260 [Paenibacillus barcinonensis]
MSKTTAITLDLSAQTIDAAVKPAMHYTPAIFTVSGSFGSVELMADDDQLAAMAQAITLHFQSKGVVSA